MDGCPDAASFLAQVAARTQLVHVVPEGEGLRGFAVEVHRGDDADANTYAGSLTITSGERRSSRDLAAESCEDLVAVMALVAALAVDPRASTKPAAELLPPAPDPSPPAPSPRPTDSMGTPTREHEPKPEPPRRTWRIAAGATGGGRVGVLPSGSPEGAAFVSVANTRGLPLLFRVGGDLAPTQQIDVVTGHASFGFATGRMDGCVLRFGPSRLNLRPCATAEVGRLTGSAKGFANLESANRLWMALGLATHAEWELSRMLFVTGWASVLAPLRADRFFLNPDTTVHRVATLGGVAGLGVGFVPFP